MFSGLGILDPWEPCCKEVIWLESVIRLPPKTHTCQGVLLSVCRVSTVPNTSLCYHLWQVHRQEVDPWYLGMWQTAVPSHVHRYLSMREPGVLAHAIYFISSLNVVCISRDSVAVFSSTGCTRQETISSHNKQYFKHIGRLDTYSLQYVFSYLKSVFETVRFSWFVQYQVNNVQSTFYAYQAKIVLININKSEGQDWNIKNYMIKQSWFATYEFNFIFMSVLVYIHQSA